MSNAVNWFEIPVKDFNRAKNFYSTIFDIDMQEQTMGPYQMGFFPGGGVGGAIVKGEGNVPSKEGVVVYLNGGDDLTAILNKVEKSGGKITEPKRMVTEEIGYIAFFTDTEGNRIGLHSPK